MKIGYVGLGSMGGALARRLQLKFSLSVFDRDQGSVQRMKDLGASACADLVELAKNSDVILLCLPTSDHVRSVLFGEKGIARAAKSGTLIVDQTTGDPVATRAMISELAEFGVEMIDAPVSGGPKGADAGTISIMVGAGPAQYERALPVLQAISPNIFHAGGVGNGHVAKLANNLLSAVQRLASMEAIALAQKNGMDAGKMVEIMMAGPARNFFLENHVRNHILSGKLASGFTVGLLHKDIKLACKLGVDSDVTMFFGSVAQEFTMMTMNEMGRDTQVYATALMMDRIAGAQVVPAGYSLT
jgi:3-hydroxyisobutyrate dehydrogenase